MRFLLDTHVVLWLLAGDRRAVPADVSAMLDAPDSEPLVSAVVIWEIAIKRSLGKLRAEDRWLSALQRLELSHLPITALHAAAVEDLPWHHRDPFDRMLVAQARVEECSLVSADRALSAYDVPLLWS